jgi:crotonobetaine/carnitine-CoA ligase
VTHHRPLPHVLVERAAATPDLAFLQMVDGPAATYGEVVEALEAYAAAFAHAGVAPGERVAIMLPNGIDAITAWLGAAWLTAYEVPVNTSYQGNMLAYILDNSGARMLVTCAAFVRRVEAVADRLTHLRTIVVIDEVLEPSLRHIGTIEVIDKATFLASGASANDAVIGPGPEPWDICSVMYTSGTTGPSKGVLVPWAQYLASTVSQPIEHMAALVGGRVVIRDTFSTSRFWHDIRTHDCVMTFLVSAMYQFVMSQPRRPDDARSPLRYVGMVPVPADIDDFKERFGVRVCTAYNSTEISSPISSAGFDMSNANHRAAGRAREGYQCRVVDVHDNEVARGELGELIVRTDQPWMLMAGYLDMPDATARAWRNGWFHTGDGFIEDADGWFHFVDRKKDAIRRRGENISSLEVEAEVNSHDDVIESAAVPFPSPLGEDDVKVWVVRRENSALTEAELIEHLRPRMPAFMVPRYVELVEALPKTDTMKIRKTELVERGNSASTWDRER